MLWRTSVGISSLSACPPIRDQPSKERSAASSSAEATRKEVSFTSDGSNVSENSRHAHSKPSPITSPALAMRRERRQMLARFTRCLPCLRPPSASPPAAANSAASSPPCRTQTPRRLTLPSSGPAFGGPLKSNVEPTLRVDSTAPRMVLRWLAREAQPNQWLQRTPAAQTSFVPRMPLIREAVMPIETELTH